MSDQKINFSGTGVVVWWRCPQCDNLTMRPVHLDFDRKLVHCGCKSEKKP